MLCSKQGHSNDDGLETDLKVIFVCVCVCVCVYLMFIGPCIILIVE